VRRGAVLILGGGLAALALTADARDTGRDPPGAGPGGPQEAEVTGVAVDPQTQQGIVRLTGKRDRRSLTMVIGPFEANGIAIPLQGLRPPRPLTHDLLLGVMGHLRGTLTRVVITDLRDETYYARLHVDAAGTALEIDSRPSDAIALALRAGVPIVVEDRVFEKAERAGPRPSGPTL
jgi:bifunctional DNase/RNase